MIFLSRDAEVVLGVLALIFFALVLLAKRHPEVAWLRLFRPPQLSAAQQERQRKRANRYAGIELILFGLILPMGYAAMTVMMFNDFDPVWTTIVIVSSLASLGIGVTAIVKNRG